MKLYSISKILGPCRAWPIIVFGTLLTTAVLSFVPTAHAQKADDAAQILGAAGEAREARPLLNRKLRVGHHLPLAATLLEHVQAAV